MSIRKNSNLTPAVCRISFAPLVDIDSISASADRFSRNVSFKSGKTWQDIYFTPGTAEFSEKSKDTEAGDLFEQSLKFIFPGEDEYNLASLDLVLGRPALVRIEYSSGMSKLLGAIDNGAKLSQVTQISSKVSGSQMEFTCLAAARSCWIT